MFFGSMLVLISTDLMWEWLVMAAAKMMGTEYAVCIATFVAIMIMGIETGTAQHST
jgi:predicted membrane protein